MGVRKDTTALKFSDLQRKQAPLKFTYRGDEVNIVYKTEVMTPAYRAQLSQIGKERPLTLDERATVRALTDGLEGLSAEDLRARLVAVAACVGLAEDAEKARRESDCKMLADLLVSWDVMDDGELDEEKSTADAPVYLVEPKPIPISYETLLLCSDSFLGAIGKEILGDIANPTRKAS